MEHGLTVGAEEEFLVVDRSGHLSYRGAELAGDDTDDSPGELAKELARSQVETNTPVCHDAAEVARQLAGLRERVGAGAGSRGLRLLPSGTPVLAERDAQEITPSTRYQRMAGWFGGVAQTSNTCGGHVHIGVPDRADGIVVSNGVRAWLPVFLALTANSPFSEGQDTSYASWRHIMWSRWPSAGPPPRFDSLDHYEDTVDTLLRSGALLDKGMVYWDIRLSEHQPTVEFRVCDVAATAAEAALVAGLIRGLVATVLDAGEDRSAPPVPQEVLRANLWRAAREGLTGRCLHPVSAKLVPIREQVADLVERIRPRLRADGDLEFVEEHLAALWASGGGADRQRAAHGRRGVLTDVVDHIAFDGGERAGHGSG